MTNKKINFLSPVALLAIGFGSGLSPYLPGTVGSLAAIILWLPLSLLPPVFYWLVIILSFVLGVVVCQKTANALGRSDPSCIVWDEFVGMWITLYFIPQFTWQWIVAAFLFFRFFDIIKPWPIGWVDRHVKGGLGIMIDDLLAGFLSGIVITLSAVLM